MNSELQISARNASLSDLAEILRDQHARKADVVVPATAIVPRNGMIVVRGAEPVLSADGVTAADGLYRPTDVFDEGLSAKLGIPRAYLRRMRTDAPDLYDANVSGWLHGRKRRLADGTTTTVREADSRRFLLRLFRGDGGAGVARAFLSDSYRLSMDNLDVLTAALSGVRDAGVEAEVAFADLTERRMRVRVAAPGVRALAPTLLEGYRSPFTGARGADNPVVFAGFDIGNSETGGGAFTLTPVLTIQVCSNGMVITAGQIRRVHLGAKLEEGLIRYRRDTEQSALTTVQLATRDAVATFLDAQYVQRQIRALEEKAGKPVENAADAIETVTKALQFSEDERAGVLDHFIKGGQLTAGGVMQAVTSFSQTVGDPDRAFEIEMAGVAAMEAAAKL